MKTLYLDTFSGISGDMMLGLLLDLGVDQSQLEQKLEILPISGYQLKVGREQRHGIEGCRVQVLCEETHHHRSWSTIDTMLEQSELTLPVRQLARNFSACWGKRKPRFTELISIRFTSTKSERSMPSLIWSAQPSVSIFWESRRLSALPCRCHAA